MKKNNIPVDKPVNVEEIKASLREELRKEVLSDYKALLANHPDLDTLELAHRYIREQPFAMREDGSSALSTLTCTSVDSDAFYFKLVFKGINAGCSMRITRETLAQYKKQLMED